MELAGSVVVVTGAGGGIGRELVLELVRRRARVAAVDLAEDRLVATASAAGESAPVSTHVVDITDRSQVMALPDAVVAEHGVVDAVINNAGVIQPFVPLVELDFDAIDRMIDVNLHGTITMCKAFLPLLLDRPAAHVANVSSMGGFLPVPGQAVYGAAKAGVRLLTEAMYAELLETPVGVTAVMPGAIATDITTNSGVAPPGGATDDDGSHRTTAPDEAARTILDGIEADRLHVHVGTDAKLMQVAVKVAPKAAVHLIKRQMGDLLDR